MLWNDTSIFLHKIVKKFRNTMRSKILIGIMTIVWLALMASIIWQGTDGKWYVEDAEKIGRLEVAKYTNQMIVVAVSDEGARLCFYERILNQDTNKENVLRANEEKDGEWKLVLETEAIIGKNGLGKRKEGDGRTPVGVFRFTKAFGILENPGSKMEYIQVNESHYWVDDGNSKYYNQFISTDDVIADWATAEHIIEYEECYHYVLATSYNSACIPGAGSAVFLHCTSESAEATAGCIAISEVYMKKIMEIVDADCILIIDTMENVLKY